MVVLKLLTCNRGASHIPSRYSVSLKQKLREEIPENLVRSAEDFPEYFLAEKL